MSERCPQGEARDMKSTPTTFHVKHRRRNVHFIRNTRQRRVFLTVSPFTY